jgi:putative endonuclease
MRAGRIKAFCASLRGRLSRRLSCRASPDLQIGRRGERRAAAHLRKHYYYIWDTNWRCPAGEIDIVAHQGATLVFIEVKTRDKALAHAFDPTEAVDCQKQVRLRRLADRYIRAHRREIRRRRIRSFRFDIVSVWYAPRLWGLSTEYNIAQSANAFGWSD